MPTPSPAEGRAPDGLADPFAATGVVLAGGRSARFGADKLALSVGGRPLLERAVAAVSTIAAETIVVVGPEAAEPPGVAEGRYRVVRDPSPHPGPLVGFVAALEVAREPLVLVVGGDMPALEPELLSHLVRELAGSDADSCVLVRRGRWQPLPSVVRLGATLPVARHLVAAGERSLRGLFQNLRTRAIAEADWRPFDPEARSLLDVDRPGDLAVAEAAIGGRGTERREAGR